jgi:hypothetical protein
MKMIATAVGMQAADLRRLLAKGGDAAPLGNQEYSIYQRSANAQIKALKVLIENNQKVFESEYGRITPLEKDYFSSKDPTFLMTLCRIECLDPGDIVQSCRAVYGKGSCPELRECGDNTCDRQSCPNLKSCGTDECPGQKCPTLTGCGTKVSQVLDKSLFVEFKSDPYIQYLFKRFDVTTAEALANQVNDLLNQR